MQTLKDYAEQMVGNYLKWRDFARTESLDSAGNWCIVYTSNRDSRLLDESNAAAIEKIMEPFTDGDNPDCIAERHNHWAVGYVDGYAIRVYHDDGSFTPAFTAWHNIQERMDSYPILDESDYSERECNATWENVKEQTRYVAGKYGIDYSEELASKVHEWLSEHTPNALESRDDQGGYPDDDEIEAALTGLWLLVETEIEA